MDALRNTQLNDSKGGLSKAIGRSVVGAVGAAAMIYLVICALQERAPAENAMTGSFATRMGEHRCEKLPDESQVCLNTNTKIRYAINRHTRTVELVSGEASFTVKSKDPRSFDVLSGGLLVHDLSTSFDVYRKIQTTLVTVIDGQVTVVAPLSPASLSEFRHVEPVSAWKGQLTNDFEAPVLRSYPELKKIKETLYDAGAIFASMTGSGSSFFGIFEKENPPSKKHIAQLPGFLLT